jgi:hypothetical protein
LTAPAALAPPAEREGSLDLYPTTPWELRLMGRIPLPPLWGGVAIGLGVFALFLVYTAVFSAEPGHLDEVGRNPVMMWAAELIQDLFLGFTLAIVAGSVCGARRDLDALWPYLGAGADRASVERAVFHHRPWALLAGGVACGVAGVVVLFADAAIWENGRRVPWTHPSAVWLGVRNFLNWFVVSRAMLLELTLARRFSGLGDRLTATDLLDRAPVAPFASRALRNAMVWMLLTAFLSLTYLGEGWSGNSLGVALTILGSFTAAAFFLPLVGAHARIRRLKAAELARVRAAMEAARAETLARSAQDPSGGRLADLIAYEGRIAAVREWPVETSAWLRLVLYFAIGFGSWVGAALVERLLDTALGGPGS